MDNKQLNKTGNTLLGNEILTGDLDLGTQPTTASITTTG